MRLAPFVLVSIFLSSTAYAQLTTGTLRGTVRSADDGAKMALADVTLLDVPTGDKRETTSNTDGEFVFTGLQVGGPYRVTATVMGYKPAEINGIEVTADNPVQVTLALQLEGETIVMKGPAVPRDTSARTVITSQEIDELPSIDRDPRDMVRRTPEVTVEGSTHVMSIGGMNPRFNSITIDGLRMDDDFGLNSSGYPTNRSPIPLSAIGQMVVQQSPFDVRYDKFLGGNVNIITKSGTNAFHGELLGTYSSNGLLGHQNGDNNLSDTSFHEYRYGAELDGPIIQDKLHFVIAAEGLDTATPISRGPLGSGAANITSKVTQDEVAMAQQIAKSVYGFDAGVPSVSLREGNVNVFAKLDYTIDPRNRVAMTFLHNDGNQIQSGTANSSILSLTSQWYNSIGILNSGALRWFSDVTDRLSTEVSVAGKIVNSRVPPLEGADFMSATILTPEGGQIKLGPDDFRQTNELDNDLLQARAVANYLAGKNLVTGGVDYELLHVYNLFIPDTHGAATYDSLADFMNQRPAQVSFDAATTPELSGAAADFNTHTLAPFLQDQLKLTDKLTLTAGLRFEIYKADNDVVENSTFTQRYANLGLTNTSTLDGKSLLMPRLGLSYLVTDRLNLRLGGGLYSGGTPTVWMSNMYSNDGVRITTAFDNNIEDTKGFDGRNPPPAVKNMLAPGNGNIDALDPKFKLPSAWKVGTGADWELPGGLVAKLNYVYTRVQDGVFWVDLRRCNSPASTRGVCSSIPGAQPLGKLPDGRPYYDPDNFPSRLGYDMMLSNYDGYGDKVRGYGHTASLLLSKQFRNGLFLAGSYAYQDVLDATPANSSISKSNYANLAVVDPNLATLARSDYETTHRFTLSIEYSHALIGDLTQKRPWKDMKTSFGLFAETRSGQPFSWTFGDSNAGLGLSTLFGEDQTIARTDRMLFYVPNGTGNDVILNGISQSDFNNFLHQTGLDRYKGKIAPRNAFTGPWVSRIDMRLAQDLPNPFAKTHMKVFVDIQNLGNLLNNHWGRVEFVPFPYTAVAVDVTRDTATGKYVYSNLRNPNQNYVDLVQSVWKMSVGLMFNF